MDLHMLTNFLMWCSVLNIGLLFFLLVMMVLAKDLAYKIQSKFFPISKETFDIIMYSFLGLYKMFILVFCVIPYIALLIIR